MKEQNIFNNDNATANSEQIEILKKNFPNCFDKDGNFILDSFKEIIKENDLDFSQESYALNWLGKSYAQLLRNEKARTFIQPVREHNNKEANKNSQNLLIKGDNLEVLKHLRNAYSEKIKMIYIDPPYNTGSDGFVYQDDRKFSKEELMQLAKVTEHEAKRILDFTNKGSNSHSAWLTFIYPRLYIARELLREDGVIFISIDDNEQAQLKLLCDEIFGEENFVANIIWEKKYTRANDAKWFSDNHDHILCYGKNFNLVLINQLSRNSDQLSAYSNPDNHPKGKWKATPLHAKSGSNTSTYTFKNGIIWSPPKGTYRRFNDVTMKKMDDGNEIWFGKDHKLIPQRKSFLTEIKDGVTPVTIWKHQDFGHNHEANDNLKKLNLGGLFQNPKPIRLIKNTLLLNTFTDNQNIVLDFFAGSGTTAHATMDLNVEDNGNRQFILVQLPEETDKKSEAYKAGYKTIFDITQARIEKAAEKIKQENPEYSGDLGFKIFETSPLPKNYDGEIVELSAESQNELFDGANADQNLLDAILTTWILYDRIPLTHPLDELSIDNYSAQYSHGHNTLYLMHPNFTTQNIKTLIDKIETEANFIPEKIVVYGFNFDSKTQRELNEALRSYQNKKSLNIDLLIRYY